MPEYTEEQGIRWFGADVDHDTARPCLETLGRAVKETFGVPIYRTPGLTGLMAWQKRWGYDYSPLPGELQDLIRSTTGQGRFECCPVPQRVAWAADQPKVGWLPALVCLDMRWAYMAAAQAITGGKEWRHEERPAGGWEDGYEYPGGPNGYLGWAPARYLVRSCAPDDWTHVGILPIYQSSGWTWPSSGVWEDWADYTEVRLAIECGWSVEILERLVCVDEVRYYDRPLRGWCKALLWMRDRLCLEEDRQASLYRAAIRLMILQAIGMMASGQQRTVTRRVGSRDELPGHSLGEESYYTDKQTGEVVYQDPVPSGITRMLHPEIAAAVWGQTRTWLLCKRQQVPGGISVAGNNTSLTINTGALSLPREQIVGFGLDSLYLTADPSWPDDGGEGRWRVKWRKEGPLPAPSHRGELEALGK